MSASRFNAAFLGDFSAPSSDVEGALAAAGNINIASYTIGLKLPCDGSENAVAGGSFTWNGGDLKSGNLVYGTSLSLSTMSLACNTTPPIKRDSTNFFATLANDLTSTATYLNTLNQTGTTSILYSSLNFNLTSNGVNVFYTTCTDMNSGSVSQYAFTGSYTPSGVIVNVAGTSCKLKNGGWQPNGFDWRKVIWNFPQATYLELNSVSGTVLAPKADINKGYSNYYGAVNGQVFGKSWTGAVQINLYPFYGCIPQQNDYCSPFKNIPQSGCTCVSVGTGCSCQCPCC